MEQKVIVTCVITAYNKPAMQILSPLCLQKLYKQELIWLR